MATAVKAVAGMVLIVGIAVANAVGVLTISVATAPGVAGIVGEGITVASTVGLLANIVAVAPAGEARLSFCLANIQPNHIIVMMSPSPPIVLKKRSFSSRCSRRANAYDGPDPDGCVKV